MVSSISVIGLGKLGAPVAACFAARCFAVHAVDINPRGPSFPRDNRALAPLASRVGASSGLAEATDIFNRAQIKSLAELVKSQLSGSDSIGILGLTYKPETDVVEESFGLLLALELTSASLGLIVFDPSSDAARAFSTHVARSSVVVLATPWQEFRDLPASAWARPVHVAPRIVIDCWRALGHLKGVGGIRYVRLGFGGAAELRVEVTSSAR